MKKRILILGSTGFIGRNLSEQLNGKYQLLTPKHSELDLTDESLVSHYFRSNKIDIVINAVVSGGSRKEEQEELALKKNILMFFNLVRNRKYYKKLIHFGSGAEYDKRRPLINIKESDFDTWIPSDDYGLFKYICSKYIENLDNIVNLRIFGLFGKYEDYRYRFISNAICLNLLGKPIVMRQNVLFDYVCIEDFIKIVEYFINRNPGYKFYNIGSGKKIDLLTIARLINKIAEKKSKIIVGKTGLNNEYTCNNHRLMKEVKYFKFSNFESSLNKLYGWYKDNLHSIKL